MVPISHNRKDHTDFCPRPYRIAQKVDAIGMHKKDVEDTFVTWYDWWVRGGPDWPNEATRPLRKKSLEAEDVQANITGRLKISVSQNLIKRAGVDGFDSSVFDEGGAGHVDW